MTVLAAPEIAPSFRVGVMSAPGQVEFLEVETPDPGLGQALVRVEAAAICTFEQRTYTGVQENRFPFVGGHEISGTVLAFGPGYRGSLRVGDRVSLGGSACGACHWCWTGRDRACPHHYAGAVKYGEAWGPGGFAEYKIHPADAIFPTGDVPFEVAALAEPLSCALHAARLAGLGVGADVVVIGAGVMGLMNVIALKHHGCRVIVSELDPHRLEMAKVFGADEAIDAGAADPVAAVKELTDGRGAEAVVTAIGHPTVNDQALGMVADRGSIVLFASAHPETPLNLSPNALHNREQVVRGVVSSDQADFYAATRLIRHGLVDLRPLIQEVFSLSDLTKALDLAVQPGTYRVVLSRGGSS